MKAELIEAAQRVRGSAYAPYSGFAVGAAVEAGSGTIYAGCNVENASYGLTLCAERVAILKAVSAGERTITALAVDSEPGATPCGACRQVLREFAPGLRVIYEGGNGERVETTIEALLPGSMGPRDLSPEDGEA